MRAYGAHLPHQKIDRKRRYLSAAMSHEDRREERADKRRARAAGEVETNAQAAETDPPHAVPVVITLRG